jgi:hypothetical protein
MSLMVLKNTWLIIWLLTTSDAELKIQLKHMLVYLVILQREKKVNENVL